MLRFPLLCLVFVCLFVSNVLSAGTAGSFDFLEGLDWLEWEPKNQKEDSQPGAIHVDSSVSSNEDESLVNAKEYMKYLNATFVRN